VIPSPSNWSANLCCLITVKPLDKVIAETILRVGQFTLSKEGGWLFEREVEEKAWVLAGFEGDHLKLTLRPGVHTMADHLPRRLMAAVMFEIAARYAEKVGGVISQHSNIGECRTEHGQDAVIAHIPVRPFRLEDVCLGFREVLGRAPPSV